MDIHLKQFSLKLNNETEVLELMQNQNKKDLNLYFFLHLEI